MRNISQIHAPSLGQKSRHILASKTKPETSDPLYTQLAPHIVDCGLDDGVDFGGWVLGQPFGQVESGLLLLDGNGVAGEQVGHDDEVGVGGEGVGEKLVLEEGHAENVGDVEEGFGGGGGVGWVGDVCFDYKKSALDRVFEDMFSEIILRTYCH
jgi:hypothetical protein